MEGKVSDEQLLGGYRGEEPVDFSQTALIEKALRPDIRIQRRHHSLKSATTATLSADRERCRYPGIGEAPLPRSAGAVYPVCASVSGGGKQQSPAPLPGARGLSPALPPPQEGGGYGFVSQARPSRALTTRAPDPAREPWGRASMVLFDGEGVPSPAPPRVISPRSGAWGDAGEGRDLGRLPGLSPALPPPGVGG